MNFVQFAVGVLVMASTCPLRDSANERWNKHGLEMFLYTVAGGFLAGGSLHALLKG